MRFSRSAHAGRKPPVGSLPGTLVLPPTSEPPRITRIRYGLDKLEQQEILDPEQLAAEPGREDEWTWVDVQGLGDEAVLRRLGEIYRLHPLALEDVVNVPSRPKAEVWEPNLVVITRMVRMEEADNDLGFQISIEQVGVVLAERTVVTFQERYLDVLDPVRVRLGVPGSRLRRHGSGYLVYVLLDTIVDGYYPVVGALGTALEEIEEGMVGAPSTSWLRRLNRVRGALLALRRAVAPQREALASLLRDEHARLGREELTFLRDTHDHCVQAVEAIEVSRELASTLLSTHLALVGNRTNDVMKVLTLVASLFVPLTFVAGIYGMNFQHMPELSWRWGYPAVLAVMATVTGGMLWFFHRRGWLGGGGDGEE